MEIIRYHYVFELNPDRPCQGAFGAHVKKSPPRVSRHPVEFIAASRSRWRYASGWRPLTPDPEALFYFCCRGGAKVAKHGFPATQEFHVRLFAQLLLERSGDRSRY